MIWLKYSSIIFTLLILGSLFSLENRHHGADGTDQEDPYPRWIAEQLALLDGNITLGQWKKIRPDEKILLFNHGDAKEGPPVLGTWCARAESRLGLGDGNEAIRYAFFYPPEPPKNLELPENKDADTLPDQRSKLGLIWTRRQENSIDRGKELARRVRNVIDHRFGEGQAGVKREGFRGAAFCSETERWEAGEATRGSGYFDGRDDQTQSMILGLIFCRSTALA